MPGGREIRSGAGVGAGVLRVRARSLLLGLHLSFLHELGLQEKVLVEGVTRSESGLRVSLGAARPRFRPEAAAQAWVRARKHGRGRASGVKVLLKPDVLAAF